MDKMRKEKGKRFFTIENTFDQLKWAESMERDWAA
jgi:hypothetical protein